MPQANMMNLPDKNQVGIEDGVFVKYHTDATKFDWMPGGTTKENLRKFVEQEMYVSKLCYDAGICTPKPIKYGYSQTRHAWYTVHDAINIISFESALETIKHDSDNGVVRDSSAIMNSAAISTCKILDTMHSLEYDPDKVKVDWFGNSIARMSKTRDDLIAAYSEYANDKYIKLLCEWTDEVSKLPRTKLIHLDVHFNRNVAFVDSVDSGKVTVFDFDEAGLGVEEVDYAILALSAYEYSDEVFNVAMDKLRAMPNAELVYKYMVMYRSLAELIKYVDRKIIVEYQGTFDAICEERLNLLK